MPVGHSSRHVHQAVAYVSLRLKEEFWPDPTSPAPTIPHCLPFAPGMFLQEKQYPFFTLDRSVKSRGTASSVKWKVKGTRKGPHSTANIWQWTGLAWGLMLEYSYCTLWMSINHLRNSTRACKTPLSRQWFKPLSAAQSSSPEIHNFTSMDVCGTRCCKLKCSGDLTGFTTFLPTARQKELNLGFIQNRQGLKMLARFWE